MHAARLFSSLLTGFLIALGGSAVQAAPQALAVIAPDEPVEFACSGTGCVLHLPTLCLQSYRDPPDYGTPYMIAAGGAALLVDTGATAPMRLPADGRVRITANENFSSVSLRISSETVVALGTDAIALTVEPGTVLVPVAVAGDPDPQDQLEIAVATGPARSKTLIFLENAGPRVAAAQLLSRGITSLPEFGERTDFDGQAAWRAMLAEAADAGGDPAVIDLSRTLTRVCPMTVMRRCLEMRQRDLLRDMNDRLWEALGGS